MRDIIILTYVLSSLLAASAQLYSVRGAHHRFHQSLSSHPELVKRQTCTGPNEIKPSEYWLGEQDHKGSTRGTAPFISEKDDYPVYRNVLDYEVTNDSTGDQTQNLEKAMDDDGQGSSRFKQGTTNRPAEVYLPGGTYQISKTWNLRMGTIIVGDPNNPTVIKASSDFDGDALVNGYDTGAGAPETSFMTLLKSVIIDTTAIDSSKDVAALNWGVAQGSGMANVRIQMPGNSTGHTGIVLKGGSSIAVTGVNINGGATGIKNSNQQVDFKDVYFNRCTTAYSATGGWTSILQGVTFDTCGLGVDLTAGNTGSLVLLDSKSTNSGPVIKFTDSSTNNGDRNHQIVIENLQHDSQNPIAIDSDNTVALEAVDTVDTWVWGNADPGSFQTGNHYATIRPDSLLKDGKYFTKDAPTYGRYASDQIVNAKAVTGHPVEGDGRTDDSASLNAILRQSSDDCKITYFPYGVYIVKDTLYIPPGSRIIGEAWAVVSGAGDKFKNASDPVPVIKVGRDGETGVAEIQDMRFTVAEVLPGAIIVEVNMAGAVPGDVGLWNTIITIGGTADTQISQSCQDQDTGNCKAAFMAMHLTTSSSAYIQNGWFWTADHNIDGGGADQIIATGRGILIEATKGTWLVGTGSEHHWLYNYNFGQAENVFAGLLQTETPYNQGDGATLTLPDPWHPESKYHDPDFSWCDDNDQKCRTALGVNVDGGSDIFLHNSASWAFFHGPWDGSYKNTACDATCQSNMNRVANDPENLVWYAINTKSADTVVLDGRGNPKMANNPGSWGANLVAYRQFAKAT